MTYGETRRVKPRVQILRGFAGNEPTSKTTLATPKLSEAILSGMVISLDVNGQWVKGPTSGSIPHIAYHDQSDTDVTASGKLLGLSMLGDFVIETGYYDDTSVYTAGGPIGADSVAGQVDLLADQGITRIIYGYANGPAQDVSLTNSEGTLGVALSAKTLTFTTSYRGLVS